MPRAPMSLALCALLLLASLVAACDEGAGADDGGTAASGGGDGDGDGDAGAGPAGAGATGGTLGLSCDPGVQAPASCGGAACADLGQAAADFCVVGCCTGDGQCGSRLALAGRPGGPCTPELQPDPRCAGVEGQFGPARGCCTADNECGLIFLRACAPRRDINAFGGNSQLALIDCDGKPLPGPAPPVDAGLDAGADPDADAGR